MRRILVVAAACVAGCGPTDHDELERRVGTLAAIASEGRILADGVAGDRTKATFARVHARELADGATHEAEKMADAEVEPGLGRHRARAVALAQDIGDALGDLQVFPGDEERARSAGEALAGLVIRAQRLDRQIAP